MIDITAVTVAHVINSISNTYALHINDDSCSSEIVRAEGNKTYFPTESIMSAVDTTPFQKSTKSGAIFVKINSENAIPVSFADI